MIEVCNVMKKLKVNKRDKFREEFKRLKSFNYVYALAINEDIDITKSLYLIVTEILGEEYSVSIPFSFKISLVETNKYYIVLLSIRQSKIIDATIQTVAESITIDKNTKSLYVFDTMEEVEYVCKETDI